MTFALVCDSIHAGYGDGHGNGHGDGHGAGTGTGAGASILRGVSLRVAHGELAVIVGPNGGGKTTLIRVVSGVLSPFSGVAQLGGRDVSTLSPRERAGLAAVVSQRASAPECSVREVVLMGRYARLPWHALYGREDRMVVEDAMARTATLHLASRRADTLSGGEWQRVLLARALAQQTDTLLLDEPATGLDPGRVIELFDLLAARQAAGAAVLAVLHDINLAALYASRLIGLAGGCIVFDGPPASVLTPEHVYTLYGIHATVFAHPVTGAPQICWTPGAAAPAAPCPRSPLSFGGAGNVTGAGCRQSAKRPATSSD